MTTLIFVLLAGLAVGSAIAMVVQRNPLYSAISLIGVFIALAGLYLTLAAPFLAAIQIIVYAGAIMVLVVFVIMLLNVEDEERQPVRLGYLTAVAILLAAVLFGEAGFILYFMGNSGLEPLDPNMAGNPSNVGLTSSIGTGLFTNYLLPFEITSVLLLMAIVGAMTLARRVGLRPTDVAVPARWCSRATPSTRRPWATPPKLKLRRPTRRAVRSDSQTPRAARKNRREEIFMPGVSLSWYLALSAVLFTIGVAGVIIKRNAIAMFMCIELMLNAVNLTFVAFSSYFRDVSGQLFVFIVMTVAAAEAAVGLGIILVVFRNRESLDVDDSSVLKN